MDTPPKKLSRQERLAAKLRENLHRRKAQARGLTSSRRTPGPLADPSDLAAGRPAVPGQARDDDTLPKPPPKS